MANRPIDESHFYNGIKVDFPEVPYPQQKAIMCKVITALKKSENALIESPTGTGKTLALLCSALSWQKSEKSKKINDSMTSQSQITASNVPKIYYTSRTHKQLSQVIREFKKTKFRDVKMALLGSRKQMCINENVKGENCDENCKQLLKSEEDGEDSNSKQVDSKCGCVYYKNVKKFEKRSQKLRDIVEDVSSKDRGCNSNAWDIEELVGIGEQRNMCPYFGAKILSNDADIIFCPYNYLIDPFIPERMKLDLDNQIILIDEAHNIEDHCRESTTFALCEENLVDEIKIFDVQANPHVRSPFSDACDRIHKLLEKILSFIQDCKINESNWKMLSYNSFEFKIEWIGKDILNQLKLFDVTPENHHQYKDDMSLINNHNEKMSFNKSNDIKQSKPPLVSIEKFLKFCEFIFKDDFKFLNDFRLGITKFESKKKKRRFTVTLNMWCMNPSVAFSSIGSKARSVVLASGTLSPMETFESELGIKFEHLLTNQHILPAERMCIRSFGLGPNKKTLEFTFSKRSEDLYNELGTSLLHICQLVPRGVLCFFSSYSFMNDIIQCWNVNQEFWSTFTSIKQIIIEPKEPKENNSTGKLIDEYKYAVKNPSKFGEKCTGALFLAVYRGKIAEGLDFEDDYARLVVCVGIPFANKNDLEVKMKMNYNDEVSKRNNLLCGNEWYEIQAFRAVNQALGRCLRHRKDWASLLLIDVRYGKDTKWLSKWVQTNIQHVEDFNNIKRNIREFTEARLKEVSDVSIYHNEEKNSDPLATSTPNLNNSVENDLTNRISSLHLTCDVNDFLQDSEISREVNLSVENESTIIDTKKARFAEFCIKNSSPAISVKPKTGSLSSDKKFSGRENRFKIFINPCQNENERKEKSKSPNSVKKSYPRRYHQEKSSVGIQTDDLSF